MHQDNTSADWLSSLSEYLSCLVVPVLWSWIDLGCAKPPRSLILEDSSGLSRMKAKKECPFKQTSRVGHKNVHIDDDNANLSHTYCT